MEPGQDVGTRRVAYYSYLKPGDYTFRVIACNNDGVWSESGPTLAFTALPWFWQTWWFTGGAALAGVGVGGGAARYIIRRRLHKKWNVWNGNASWKMNGRASPKTFTTISAPT